MTQKHIKPMLAHMYEKHSSKLKFPCYVQPKLDGMRCIYNYDKEQFFSRNGNIINSMNTLRDEIKEAMYAYIIARPNIHPFHIDGELYNHSMTFQQIVSSTRKTVNTENEDTRIEYHMFDIIPIYAAERNMSQEQRLHILLDFAFFAEKYFENPRLVFVDTLFIRTEDRLYDHYASFIKQKYEGIICRNKEARYKNKRSFDLLKLKPVDTSELHVFNMKEGQGKYSETLGYLECINDLGKEVHVGSGFTDAQRNEIWNNKDKFYAKKYITIKHNGYTDDNIERFPIFLAFRDYE